MLILRPIVPIGLANLRKSIIIHPHTRYLSTFLLANRLTYKTSIKSIRFNSSLNPKDDLKTKLTPTSPVSEQSAETYEKLQVINRRIPGQATQTNTIKDRFPSSLKLEKEAIPTLLPTPTSPAPSSLPLSTLYSILSKKTKPELIYESEPHKLYFLFCSCFALVFFIYAINAVWIGNTLAYELFIENDMKVPQWQNITYYAARVSGIALAGMTLLFLSLGFAFLPSRLIRRMWYLPGNAEKEAFIRFTTHPMLPSRPTPVHMVPVSHLRKAKRAKIYTGDGFYGTLDSFFMFFLFKKGSRYPWVVDRKGFFWADGRVMDLLFSDDSIEAVENSKKIDEQYGDILKLKRENAAKMKKELGVGWKTKAKGKLMIEDLGKLKKLISDKTNNDDKTPTKKN
ncbi:hypothetical protein CANARDRAFT_30110 [[Candida] arabinofermentans NRRL YB-2248]|uniref:Uncharacterized protein n=1 Tax=[Candida] arabinofermentans NRRL YB-2248 TaxID=983967 RepID=A0A1E4SV01_9ASCO|nr:hypothetical protein CANARDRAFT_30110 [[Candida] arabinofermentans NRRL YB-2248]